METALDRFLRYASLDTTSSEDAQATPSTPGQWELARMLEGELKALGAQRVLLDGNCYVYGMLPANTPGQPVIALIAHLDTADAVPGRDFRPRVVRFTGKDVVLSEEHGVRLSPADFPGLTRHTGQDLVVTGGTTVLGADDKAGIAEIMTAFEYLAGHPEVPHGEVWAVFTPDEEIGGGADKLQLDYIHADFGYTLDGGAPDEIEYENFNAAQATIRIRGRNVHPGYARGKMVNAARLAAAFQSMMPTDETPEATQGYEGFFHLRKITGDEENATLQYLIRDHDAARFEQRKEFLRDLAARMDREHGEGRFNLDIKDSYRNMKEVVSLRPEVLERAERAIRACGMEPRAVPIRGGTDGARLSFRGLPCPNLGTGGENWHGVHEFLPVGMLDQMVKVVVEIVRA
ncbi:MAG TPA: peptidase T [Candidatus Limnocylindria bacterium]|nr:peptidase T [Candidatus Limnocylindria bacterium]